MSDTRETLQQLDAVRLGYRPAPENGATLASDIATLASDAAAHIRALADELAEARRELDDLRMERKARSMIDPSERLHNICAAMAEGRGDSPYSQEAWDAQDEAYRERCRLLHVAEARIAELAALLRETIGHCDDPPVDLVERIDRALAQETDGER